MRFTRQKRDQLSSILPAAADASQVVPPGWQGRAAHRSVLAGGAVLLRAVRAVRQRVLLCCPA
jgi:hypothetical protein